ncbi:hypothetical protein H5410_056977 [Solanum commersonii]|uniref:Uncharacterized protein n=1 Tax=Solanum commersonii TaxID=4109 RepID=A0A9J5WLQ2_SOLCO|nr:hypothetical protein H5410_056977 [Solanum commersonii]
MARSKMIFLARMKEQQEEEKDEKSMKKAKTNKKRKRKRGLLIKCHKELHLSQQLNLLLVLLPNLTSNALLVDAKDEVEKINFSITVVANCDMKKQQYLFEAIHGSSVATYASSVATFDSYVAVHGSSVATYASSVITFDSYIAIHRSFIETYASYVAIYGASVAT